MRGDIENPMCVDSLWRHREQEKKSFGECMGCEEPIYAGEDYYEIDSINGETIMVHQHPSCCMQFIGQVAHCRTAGE